MFDFFRSEIILIRIRVATGLSWRMSLDFRKIPQARETAAVAAVSMDKCLAKTRTVRRGGVGSVEKGCDLYPHL